MGWKRNQRRTATDGGGRIEKKTTKVELKTSKLDARARLAEMKAKKRKALVALIVVGLIAYMVIFKGGGVSLPSMDGIKNFFEGLNQ